MSKVIQHSTSHLISVSLCNGQRDRYQTTLLQVRACCRVMDPDVIGLSEPFLLDGCPAHVPSPFVVRRMLFLDSLFFLDELHGCLRMFVHQRPLHVAIATSQNSTDALT